MKNFNVTVTLKKSVIRQQTVRVSTKRQAAEAVAGTGDLVASTPSVFVHDTGTLRTIYTVEAVDRPRVHGGLELQ